MFLLILLISQGCGASRTEITIGALSHFNRGNERMSQHNPRGAVPEYIMAIELDDEQAEYHFNLGLAYYQLLLYEQAADSYQTALDLRPDFAEAWYNFALALDKMGESERAFMAHDTYLKLQKKNHTPTSKPTDSQ